MHNDFYTENIKSICIVVGKFGLLLLALGIILLILGLILKNYIPGLKKIASVVIAFGVIELLLLLLPRVIDFQRQSFVVLSNAQFSVTSLNDWRDGSITMLGLGQIIDENGKEHLVTGVNLCELPSKDETHIYHGTIIYAKYSRQLVAIYENEPKEQQ